MKCLFVLCIFCIVSASQAEVCSVMDSQVVFKKCLSKQKAFEQKNKKKKLSKRPEHLGDRDYSRIGTVQTSKAGNLPAMAKDIKDSGSRPNSQPRNGWVTE